jgi:hypothetical protein
VPVHVIPLIPVQEKAALSVVPSAPVEAPSEPVMAQTEAQPVAQTEAEPVVAQTEAEPIAAELLPSEIPPEPVVALDSVASLAAEDPVPELEAIRSELETVVPEFALEQTATDAQLFAEENVSAGDAGEPMSDWPIWQPITAAEETEVALPGGLQESALAEIREAQPSIPALAYRAIRTRLSGDERLFWRTATVAALVAVSALVLGASYHRVSPLPAAVMKGTVPAQTPPAVSLPVRLPEAHPPAKSPAPPSSPFLKSASVRQREVTSAPATKQPEVDIVAPDTVVRYHKQPATPPAHSSKRVVSSNHHPTENDVVAEDTVTRFGKVPVHPQK